MYRVSVSLCLSCVDFPTDNPEDMGYIDAPQTYHTSQDCASHVSQSMLQHQGDNVLAFVKAVLALPFLPAHDAAASTARLDRAVYFDVLGLSMVVYSRLSAILIHLAFWASAVALLVLFARRNRQERFGSSVGLSLVMLAAVLAGLLMGIAIGQLVASINPLFYQGNVGLALALVGSCNVAAVLGVMFAFQVLRARTHCLCSRPSVLTEASLWQALLTVVTVLLAISVVLCPFLGGAYMVLPIAFTVILAVVARMILVSV
jgi:hypothetical protein